jgi:hypothetical protein
MAYNLISEVPFRSGAFDGPGILGGFGEGKAPACPPFIFKCICPFPDLECKARKQYLCDRILGAIKLATRAVSLLEATHPTADTVQRFHNAFKEVPTDKWEVPGHPGRKIDAGKLVAQRFRAVAHELRTSDTTYSCDEKRCQDIKHGNRCTTVGPGVHTLSEVPSCHPTDIIIDDTIAMALLCKNEVLLCPEFWDLRKRTKLQQEGTILHEMFHLRFGVTCSWFQHDQKERRKNSAYCYEVFAVSLKGPASQASITRCQSVPV